jgi:hypothetical protein
MLSKFPSVNKAFRDVAYQLSRGHLVTTPVFAAPTIV